MIEDSPRRCVRCFKKMRQDMGQDDSSGDSNAGVLRIWHVCDNCGYRERDDQWKRPRIPVHSGPTMAEQLHKARTEGWVVPFRYDLPAVEEAEFGE